MTVWDAIVVGAGPGGTTCAHALARRGHRVLLLEAGRHPRFSIGESLLPSVVPLLEELGVDPTRDGHLVKRGAVFHDEAQGRSITYDFRDVLPGGPTHAYQVERSSFDARLLESAEAAGASVRQETPVSGVRIGPDQVTVLCLGREEQARFVIDASGRARVLARTLGRTHPMRNMGKAAMYCHAADVDAALWTSLVERADVEIFKLDGAWAWAIPLRGRRLSIGVVLARGKLHPRSLDHAVEASPRLKMLLQGTSWTQQRTAADWSYRTVPPTGPRWACIGDAAGFLDPIFSSGVALAMQSGLWTGRALAESLAQGTEGQPEVLDAVQARMRRGYQTFHQLIHRFYETAIFDTLLLAEDPDPTMRRGLTTLLAGDLWRDDNPFEQRLVRSRVRPADDTGA